MRTRKRKTSQRAAADETHKYVPRLRKPTRTFPASCNNKKNPEEAQEKKEDHLYSTGPPAWTAVEAHVAALRGWEEGSSKREREKNEGRGWEEKIVSDD